MGRAFSPLPVIKGEVELAVLEAVELVVWVLEVVVLEEAVEAVGRSSSSKTSAGSSPCSVTTEEVPDLLWLPCCAEPVVLAPCDEPFVPPALLQAQRVNKAAAQTDKRISFNVCLIIKTFLKNT